MEKELINYPIREARTEPVINIAGRDYVVLPVEKVFNTSAERIAAYERNGRDGLGVDLQIQAHGMFEEILRERLLDAVPFTVTEEPSGNPAVRNFRMMVPVLMPADTREKWDDWSDENFNRIVEEHQARMGYGEPYTFKLVERKED